VAVADGPIPIPTPPWVQVQVNEHITYSVAMTPKLIGKPTSPSGSDDSSSTDTDTGSRYHSRSPSDGFGETESSVDGDSDGDVEEASYRSTRSNLEKLVEMDVRVVWVSPGMIDELIERGVRRARDRAGDTSVALPDGKPEEGEWEGERVLIPP